MGSGLPRFRRANDSLSQTPLKKVPCSATEAGNLEVGLLDGFYGKALDGLKMAATTKNLTMHPITARDRMHQTEMSLSAWV